MYILQASFIKIVNYMNKKDEKKTLFCLKKLKSKCVDVIKFLKTCCFLKKSLCTWKIH